MDITKENIDVAISMMTDAENIGNYNEATQICRNLKVVCPEHPAVNFYWCYLTVLPQKIYGFKTIEFIEKTLSETTDMLIKSEMSDDLKRRLYEKFIDMTIYLLSKPTHDSNRNSIFMLYYNAVGSFLDRLLWEYVTHNKLKLENKTIIHLGKRIVELAVNYMQVYELSNIPWSSHPEVTEEEYVDLYFRLEKSNGKWLLETNQVTQEDIINKCIEVFEESKEWYKIFEEDYQQRKKTLEARAKSLIPWTRLQAKKALEKLDFDIEDYSIAYDSKKAYAKMKNQLSDYRVRLYQVGNIQNSYCKKASSLYYKALPDNDNLEKEAIELLRKYLEEDILPDFMNNDLPKEKNKEE